MNKVLSSPSSCGATTNSQIPGQSVQCVHSIAPYPYPPIAREIGLVVIELHCTATSPLHHNIYILQCYKETRRREGLREGEEKIVLDWR